MFRQDNASVQQIKEELLDMMMTRSSETVKYVSENSINKLKAVRVMQKEITCAI